MPETPDTGHSHGGHFGQVNDDDGKRPARMERPPVCPRCGMIMRCLRNEISVDVDGETRIGDLYWCGHDLDGSAKTEYAVCGLSKAPGNTAN